MHLRRLVQRVTEKSAPVISQPSRRRQKDRFPSELGETNSDDIQSVFTWRRKAMPDSEKKENNAKG